MIVLILIILGLVLGSFVNAAVWRLHEQELLAGEPRKVHKKAAKTIKSGQNLSIVSGRSMCTHCRHELSALDLVPVLSYLWLRGRCRYCRKPIEDSPLAELLVPLLFVVSYLYWPLGFNGGHMSYAVAAFALWIIFLVAFVALALYDIRWYLLPDRIVYPLIGLGLVQIVLQVALDGHIWQHIIGAAWGVLFTAGLFFVIFELSDGAWIGFGDVKLAIVLGLLVGGPLRALLLIFIASLLGSLVAVPLLVQGKAGTRTPMPFGPFLLAATVIVVLFGSHITIWYDNLLHLPSI